MDKNAIKKYAVWARRELIERVAQRAMIYGITESDCGDPNADSINGHLLTQTEKRQRQALIRKIKEKGYEQVMEEVAYTWFNRFAALRFMEVNGYLPSHIRVFTNDEGEFKPQILTEAIHLELDGLDMNKVYELESANKSEELFKYLLIVQCNALNSILPGMFQNIDDYTEMLLPDYLLREGSVIEQMVTTIPEEDWTDQVQIIGWLYQYYNTEPKDQVFANLKKKIKITKENIPAVTQIFTPDWIVHYMVENSLGRLWLEGHPNDALKSEWKYYLDEAEQEPEVQEQLAEIRKEYAALKPEEIRVIDPCMGSGHILCVLFDVLVRIYEDYGYTAREAALKIVENNLWGLDIDERAAQLSYFAVMMKARQYDRRFFIRKVQPHVYSIQESNNLDRQNIEYFVDSRNDLRLAVNTLIDDLQDAKEYGSILKVTHVNYDILYSRFNEIVSDISLYRGYIFDVFLPFVQCAQALSQQYHVTTTNPPYMASGSMSLKLSSYIKKKYPIGKNDLYSVFIERSIDFTLPNCFVSMITQHSWMFLSRFERLRTFLQKYDLINMAHLGARAFEEIGGEIVQTTSFVKRKTYIHNYVGIYCRLIDGNSQDQKEEMFLSGDNRFHSTQMIFGNIYGTPIAYWISSNMMEDFTQKELGDYGETRQGFATGDNERFLRFWYEVELSKIAFDCEDADAFWKQGADYAPCNKGGEARKWYGNNYIVCKYNRTSFEALLGMGNHLPSRDYYFRSGLTWSTMGTNYISMRYTPAGFLFETKGSMYFSYEERNLKYLLGVMNSKVAMAALQVLCPTIDFKEGPVSHVPIIINEKEQIDSLVEKNIAIAKEDWDSFEISWDFKTHPLARGKSVKEAFVLWEVECQRRFELVKSNEEKINHILIKTYNLEEEITPEVNSKEITIHKANKTRDIKSLISYSVGCMLGRYSLDQEGISYAGGNWNDNYSQQFPPVKDGIIPICDDEYFQDDIVSRFVEFIKILYGKKNLEENLDYIAEAIGKKGTSREIIRNYFLTEFYSDHLKTYKKRPIYWLFDSGKKNGFKCLVYIHRYKEDTIARIRTDYLHEQQERYRTSIENLEDLLSHAGSSERVSISKKKDALQAQAEEARVYEEKVHNLADQMIRLDLDRGVKNNYEVLSDVLARLK